MQLPAFSGHKKAINLLPKDPFESSGVGVVLEWALVFGKWAVILTQLVVMAAFLWRFGLDRKLTNIRREIDQQIAVIDSYAKIESDFVLSKRVEFLEPAIANQQQLVTNLQLMQSLTPPDVWYERMAVEEKGISMTGYSGSLTGFSRLLTAMQRRPEFKSVSVGSIEEGGTEGARLRFDISLGYGKKK